MTNVVWQRSQFEEDRMPNINRKRQIRLQVLRYTLRHIVPALESSEDDSP